MSRDKKIASFQVSLGVLLVVWIVFGFVVYSVVEPLDASFYGYLGYAFVILISICSARSRSGILFYIVFELTLTAIGIVIVLALITVPRSIPLTLLRNASNNTTTTGGGGVDTFTQFLFDHMPSSKRGRGCSGDGCLHPPTRPVVQGYIGVDIVMGLVIVMKLVCLVQAFRAFRAITAAKKRNNKGDVELDSSTSSTSAPGPYYVNIEPAFTAQPVYPTSGFQYP